jgi:hypothetical protein
VAADVANGMPIDDSLLWWLMVGTALCAAGASIAATILDRRGSDDRNLRFSLHMIGYIMMSMSVLVFVFRGLLSPA